MKNKNWSKLGISIAAAVAPAAALGVVAGVVVANLPKGEQETDWEGFMTKYEEFFDQYNKDIYNDIGYEDEDITGGKITGELNISGEVYSLSNVKYEEDTEQGQKYMSCTGVFTYQQESMEGLPLVSVPSKVRSEMEELMKDLPNQKFYMSNEYVSVDLSNSTTGLYWKLKYNKYGYLESMDIKNEYMTVSQTFIPTIPPHKLTK